MSLFVNQLLILLWKSWITQKRHWVSTLFQLIIPLLLALLISWSYSKINNWTENQKYGSDPTYSPYNDLDKPVTPISVTHPPVIYSNPYLTVTPDSPNFNNYLHYNIFYGPSTPETDKLMKTISSSTNFIVEGLESGDSVDNKLEERVVNSSGISGSDYVIMSSFGSRTFGIIFDTEALKRGRLTYTIRMVGNMDSYVNRLFPYKSTPGPANDPIYYKEWCILQTLINNDFVKQMSNNRQQISRISAFQLPYPSYKPREEQWYSLQDLIAATIVIGYVIMCPLIVKRITDEKVTKAKELLRMVGMSDWVFWISHFIAFFLIMVFHCFVLTYLYSVGLGGDPIMKHTNIVLVFTIFVLFSIQTILFCMSLTTVFNRPVLAVIVTVIVWICSYAIPFGLWNPVFHRNSDILSTNNYRIITSMLPTMGLSWAMAIIGQFELEDTGVGFLTLFNQTANYGYLTLGLIMLSMLSSCILYVFIIWYLDNVWPFQYGVPKSPLFLFYGSYWFPSKSVDANEKRADTPKSDLVIDNRNFETEPDERASIVIKTITKSFGGFGTQFKTVVNNLSLNIYDKQITALLGHNGAGKTTTMNMITGIYPPTSGTVLVNGYNIKTATNDARRSVGLCPQENIIFNELTVGQHMKLFAVIKGMDWKSVDAEVDNTLKLLHLTDKTNAMASSLSGGMKRKLALGLAIVGGTKILILDEPSSGLDPEARRLVWDLLQDLRSSHTILLTTHYMEEADVLGDRIAIMCDGSVKCCGSPMFLKKRFGAGYHLRVSKGVGFKGPILDQILRKYLPKAHMNSEIQSEVIYVLETDDNTQNTTSVFPNLFDEIESNKEKLGIASCGLTITTMEDVFIRVGIEFDGIDEEIHLNRKNIKNKSSESLVHKSPKYLTGFPLVLYQFYGLLIKRLNYTKRYWPMTLFQLVLPATLFVLALLTDNAIRKSVTKSKDLELNLYDMYGPTTGFIKLPAHRFDDYYRKTAKLFSMSAENVTDPDEWALKKAQNLDDYRKENLIGATIDDSGNAKIWFNNEAMHSLPLSINLFYESYIRYIMSSDESEPFITVHNHPVSIDQNAMTIATVIFGWVVFGLIFAPITVPFIGASFVLFPINERVSKAKLLQIMTGLSTTLFWFANFVFDLINHTIVVLIIYLIFLIFDFNNIFFGQTMTAVGLFLMLFLFGVASIPLAYCFSIWLPKPSTGFALLVIIYLVFGVIALCAIAPFDLVINVLQFDIFNKNKFNFVICLFRMIPVFSMSFGIQKLYRIGAFAEFCKTIVTDVTQPYVCKDVQPRDLQYGCCTAKCSATGDCYADINPLALNGNGVGLEFIFLIASGVVSTICLLLMETYWLQKLWYRLLVSKANRSSSDSVAMVNVNRFQTNEDSDVIAEKYRIENLIERRKMSEEAMVAINLTKKFGSFLAVDHLTFGLHKEECFGLLGVNGAGKTTTFSMLTGDIMLSDGNAFIQEYSVREDLSPFRKQIGYCPQFDALLEKLTGRESLYLFGRLRGIPSDVIKSEVDSLIEMCDLTKHADKCTDTYSGGTRRKLSLGLAIIGTPAVIFLDEPTAGVDPGARRKIWSTLVYIQEKYQSAIVLTSHSMEECEALCSRIAIMVNGKFKCLGPTQHLRKKFGQGFTIVIKLKRELNNDPNYVTRVQQSIHQSFPSVVLKDAHQLLLHFHITDTSVQWSYMFSVMERAKYELQLEDYLVSDTTLEQIFLAFAKTQGMT